MDTTGTTAELISAIAQLVSSILWPFIVFSLFIYFKKEISALVRRVKKGKIFGHEFELTDQIDALATKTDAAQREIYIPESSIESDINKEEKERKDESDVEKIITVSSENEEFGLILLARKIELELKRLMALGGHLKSKKIFTYSEMRQYLGNNAAVSENLRSSIQLFWDMRNKVVHGHKDVEKEQITRIIDIGLTVLSAIKSIPHEINVVAFPDVAIYKDKDCLNKIEDAKGLILETTSPGGANKLFRIFPTTRSYYKKGMTVAWEWNINNKWGEAYYKDPVDDKTKMAWSSSAEFVGSDIEKI